MSSKIEFRECPCCGKVKYGLLQDKIHLDWARECLACGYALELSPRAVTRTTVYALNAPGDEEEFDVMCSGLRMAGGLEDLFEGLVE